MRALTVAAMLCVSLNASASPQISPSNIEYIGVGDLYITVNIFNPTTDSVDIDLVLVKDIMQPDGSDTALASFKLNRDAQRTLPIKLIIKKANAFWVCARSKLNHQTIRNCTTIKPRTL